MQRKNKCACYSQRQNRWLEPSILLVLLEAPCHGYEVMAKLPDLGFSQNPIDPGAVYRTLRHMEENEFVESMWDVSGVGPAKRQYTITGEGREHLLLWTEMLNQRRLAINAFLKKVNEKFDSLTIEQQALPKND